MADVPLIAAGNAPKSFVELFNNMPDVYGGTYAPYLAEYGPGEAPTAEDLMQRTVTQLPADEVPSVFVFQDVNAVIRVVHHLHKVERPFGQPATPLTGKILGFSGEVFQNNAQLVKVPTATFFSMTGNIAVPTIATMTALLAAAPDGMLGPFNHGDPDTEIINTRRAVPVPHAYIPLFTFRTLSPSEAWQQVGGQIILDGREQDCSILLQFLRATTVRVRGMVRNQPAGPPAVAQVEEVVPPYDDQLLQHTHRRLRMILPALFFQPPPGNELPMMQTAAIIGQTVTEGFNALRADRAQERENASRKSFSEQFPATGMALRRLCLAGNDDDLLPEFWRDFALLKGKKGHALTTFANFVMRRTDQPGATGVRPIISTQLFNHIAAFELGSANLENIAQGVSPFLMCPAGSSKANETEVLTQKFVQVHEGTTVSYEDVSKLVPTNDYSIPEDLHMLVDFIGAYSIIWDVLVGEHHPLATSIRDHFHFWHKNVRSVCTAIPQEFLRNTVIIGTLRHMQVTVMDYVHNMMYKDIDTPVPTFKDVVDAVKGRTFQTLPGLPFHYHRPTPATQLPPKLEQAPTPPTKRTLPTANHVTAPHSERHPALMEKFQAGDKSIQQLRTLPGLPRDKNGTGILCISYHLRGSCFDNCRRSATHRKLDKVEIDNIHAFLEKHT